MIEIVAFNVSGAVTVLKQLNVVGAWRPSFTANAYIRKPKGTARKPKLKNTYTRLNFM